ncbi:MAG: molybdopterin molybdotransferase MoeA [Candidatus Omnitrophica bacterium]|nr:molybdopterin molybdotransferase MoeA [Candidatus Omnitrophota bacterium]MBU1127814.1 molybdopterin molybdotransferase MoeA [Candidatus Omnitrophota bacterium]MBU1657083.1 molybdopterin molybdotransferase MoeA [Candidatus Omnitrophota bacterium]MBU1784550.1 molybdopterin molybdotransferase MoeA [Candidatus Omnitrophota bacterium]MBU1851146.1 molybdopterin molybdotransferase MoeA [Candidatus Omnitrophota bacterium]
MKEKGAINFDKAYDLVLNNCALTGVEEILIEKSAGRILAETLYADMDMPFFNKSAMDGFALRSSDIKNVPVELNVLCTIKAGSREEVFIRNGTAAAVMTGAPVPKGADAVVMVERTKRLKKGLVRINSSAGKGENIRVKGEEIRKGKAVLRKDKHISAPEVAVMASVGKKTVKVYKIPRVAILATGDELVPHFKNAVKGKIRNSNTPMVSVLVRSLMAEVKDLGIARDNPADLRRKIKKGLDTDILILSGGVSMGEYDLVPRVFEECGIKKIFHKVSIKPGKPVFFGKRKHTLIFGAPGNPVSVLITFLLFIKPAIKKMSGADCSHRVLKGILARKFDTKGDRRTYFPTKVKLKDSKYHLKPINYHGSADINAVTKADGFMVIEKGRRQVRKGEEAGFIFL